MRKIIFSLAAVAVAVIVSGCNGPEQKLGRGLSNCYEVIRWGELRRSIELATVEPQPGYGLYGVVHGFDRSLQRTALGVFEVATFPIPMPTYQQIPILTKSPNTWDNVYTEKLFAPDPVYPLSYAPGRLSDALFDTDTYTGFSGGDVAPWFPGSRFQVFEN